MNRVAEAAVVAGGRSRRHTARPAAAVDLVLVERDILAAGPSSIMGAGATLTVVGGEILHQTEEVA